MTPVDRGLHSSVVNKIMKVEIDGKLYEVKGIETS
jgi:hypothetical protein